MELGWDRLSPECRLHRRHDAFLADNPANWPARFTSPASATTALSSRRASSGSRMAAGAGSHLAAGAGSPGITRHGARGCAVRRSMTRPLRAGSAGFPAARLRRRRQSDPDRTAQARPPAITGWPRHGRAEYSTSVTASPWVTATGPAACYGCSPPAHPGNRSLAGPGRPRRDARHHGRRHGLHHRWSPAPQDPPAAARRTGRLRRRPGPLLQPGLYAVDTVVPLISLDQRSTWYPDARTRDGR